MNGTDIYNLMQSKGFLQKVAEGRIDGYWWIDKYGSVKDLTTGQDPSDMREYKLPYTFTVDAGAEYFVSSSDVGNTQEIQFGVITVDELGNRNKQVFNQTIAGQTKTRIVPPVDDPIVRIYRMENEADFGNDITELVYVYEDDTISLGIPQTPGKVRAVMGPDNQTKMCIYTVPTGYVGYLIRGEAGINKSGGVTAEAEVTYKSRRYGKTFKVKKDFAVMTGGTSIYKDVRSVPDPIPAKTDLLVNVKEVSATVGMFGTFDILLVEERKLDDDYLTKIGQVKRVT